MEEEGKILKDGGYGPIMPVPGAQMPIGDTDGVGLGVEAPGSWLWRF